MKEAERSAEIPLPADEVFAFLVRRLGRERAEDIGVGSKAIVERRFFGQQIVADLEVTVYEPPRRIVLETETSGVSVQASVEIEPLEPKGCRVTFGMAMETSGFFMQAVEPMVAQAAEADIEASLTRLREVLA